MEANRIFQELMNADEMQSLFGISKDECANEAFDSKTTKNHVVAYIKEIINGVEHRKTDTGVYQNILKQKP